MKRHTLPKIWLLLWFGASISLALGELVRSPSARPVTEHWLSRTLLPPSLPNHIAGFDAFGRDVLALTLRASALSSAFALCVAVLTCMIGIIVGASTSLAHPRTRFLVSRLNDVLLAFPSLLLALAWAAMRGPGWDTLAVSLALGVLPPFTRLMQARARELTSEEYVTAARALGSGPSRLIRSHLAPPLLSLCAVKLPGLFAQALLAEATLSFLGVGAPLGRETWGALLAQGKEYLVEAPHIAIGCGIPLVLTVLSLQLISEGRTEKHLRR